MKIGPNTAIRSEQYALIRWGDGKKATKELAVAVFGRHTLATHSVTGRTSNAFREKDAKPQLDPAKIADIIGMINIIWKLKHFMRKNIESVSGLTPTVFSLMLFFYSLQNL